MRGGDSAYEPAEAPMADATTKNTAADFILPLIRCIRLDIICVGCNQESNNAGGLSQTSEHRRFVRRSIKGTRCKR